MSEPMINPEPWSVLNVPCAWFLPTALYMVIAWLCMYRTPTYVYIQIFIKTLVRNTDEVVHLLGDTDEVVPAVVNEVIWLFSTGAVKLISFTESMNQGTSWKLW